MATLEFERPLVELERRIAELKTAIRASGRGGAEFDVEVARLEEKARRLQEDIFGSLGSWQKVLLSRHPDRPFTLDYVQRLCDDFVELHGDRAYSDDRAIVGGIARFRGRSVVLIGHQKGRGVKDNMVRNFGMPHPEGYRKALRLMEMAARFRRPLLTFIDTPGAYPGLGAEERGQAEAIGQCLLSMSRLRVPVMATVIGEGGSGGALALGVANRVVMLEFSTYSVISPEGCASILWKDRARGPEAAEQLKVTADHLLRFGVVDELVPEPPGGAHRDPDESARRVGDAIERHLDALAPLDGAQLAEDRYRKYRAIGEFTGE
jgi:acetyl-CoA carboxylase carboxyl transferase subunit alpha